MGAPISSGISWAVFGAAVPGTTISGGLLTVSGNETAAYLTVKASKDGGYGAAVVTVNSKSASTPGGVNIVDGGNPSIKAKFGLLETTGTDAVRDTFNTLSAFIQDGGLSNSETSNVIKLGDYIDLEGGLKVDAYNGYGAIGIGAGTSQGQAGWVITVGDYATYNRDYSGVFLRLIVVGINSFNRVTESSNNTPHVVFQFQNIPGKRRMNSSNDNTGGYPASEMRKYLTPLDGVEGSGKFLNGIITAGVPEAVLWAPARNVTAGSYDSGRTTATISDALWLPTEWEIFGSRTYSPSGTETNTNQARLEYYQVNTSDTTDSDAKARWRRIKYWSTWPNDTGSGLAYFSSGPYPSSTGSFCAVDASGAAHVTVANFAYGFAPAFCVQ
jgi:hypothetical protein